MDYLEKINTDLKTALKEKNEVAVRTIRSIKSALMLVATEKSATKEIDEATFIKVINKLAKQRNDSITIYKEQNREDLYKKEEEELAKLQKHHDNANGPYH